jgi:hypothetical protein
MTSKSLPAALTAALLLGAAWTAASTSAWAADKVSNSVGVALNEMNKEMQKKDFPAAQASLEKAKAKASSDLDKLEIARFSYALHVSMNDLAAAEVDAEAAADMDPAIIPDAEKVSVYQSAMEVAGFNKHDDKAGKYAKMLMALNSPAITEKAKQEAAMALAKGGNAADAAALAQKNIDAAKAAGKLPGLNDLVILMQSQIAQKNDEGAATTLETMVADYNRPADIANLLGAALGAKGMRDIDYIYAARLVVQMNVKIAPADAQFLGQTANSHGFYGDAEAMQKLGGPPPNAGLEAADRKALPAQIATADKQNGQINLVTAEAAYGYGQYADAEHLARNAQTKGGVKDTTEPPMLIGMAQAAQGKYADAAATFAGINQPNPASARVLRLWGYFVKGKSAAPATAATAAPAPQ